MCGKELLELAVKLGGQRLVVRQHQRRPLHGLDDVGHGERLARAGHAHQHLLLAAGAQAVDQGRDGLRLIAGRLERDFSDRNTRLALPSLDPAAEAAKQSPVKHRETGGDRLPPSPAQVVRGGAGTADSFGLSSGRAMAYRCVA